MRAKTHQAFDEHRAISDHADVRFAIDHLGRGARRDQRVEAGDRAAGDRDEGEREHRARDDRAASADELAEGRHLQLWVHDRHGEDEEPIVPIFMKELR